MVYTLRGGVKPSHPRMLMPGLIIINVLLFGLVATVITQNVSLSAYQQQAVTQTSAAMLGAKSSSRPAPTGSKSKKAAPTSSALRSISCVSLFPAKHESLRQAGSAQLKKLAQYEAACSGAAIDRSSFFIPTPTSHAEAVAYASEVAGILKEYSAHGIKPLVFIEPTSSQGNIDLNQYKNGALDASLETYFSTIKSAGVTDSMMGMWVVLPEGNIPVWSSVDPATFTSVVTKTFGLQKKYFPGSQASLLLDSQSYPPGASWGGGRYVSLLPYVQNIPKGLVNSLGLQGFPWAPPANQVGGKSTDPAIYLQTGFAAEAAASLGTNNVWFNTGTFASMYSSSSSRVTATPAERQFILDKVLVQAETLKARGFTVSVHLFAEDKSGTAEAIDWSYWKTSPSSDANTMVFTTFAHDAAASNIPIWLFDSTDH